MTAVAGAQLPGGLAGAGGLLGDGGPLPGAGALGWTAAEGARLGIGRLGELYTSEAVLAAERQALLRPGWALVASTSEVDAGRYLATAVAGVPVVVWRDADGALAAWHNMCRHRGIPLLEEGSGPVGRRVVCPYHQWAFRLDGTLANVPQGDRFPALDPAVWGLLGLPVVEWHGMVLVQVGGSPGAGGPAGRSAAEVLGPLDGALAGWWNAPLEQVAVTRTTVGCNWKLLVENHLDVYHLWYLHARSLAGYEHRAFRWAWLGDTWWSHEPPRPGAGPSPVTGVAPVPGLDAEQAAGIGAHLVWPNMMVVTTGQLLATYDAAPLSPSSTELTLRVRAVPGADADALVASIGAFLEEDITACERLQRAVGSPAFAVGPLAEGHEDPVIGYHTRLRAALAGAGDPAAGPG